MKRYINCKCFNWHAHRISPMVNKLRYFRLLALVWKNKYIQGVLDDTISRLNDHKAVLARRVNQAGVYHP